MTHWDNDLVVLVPDKNMEATVRGILARPQSLHIRSIRLLDIYIHVERDPGCLVHGHDFLRPFAGRCEHCIILFDRVGCGQEHESRETLETAVNQRLSQTGWDDRSAVVVIDPELEAWVWNDTPHVDDELGWAGRTPCLRDWLSLEGHLAPHKVKPQKPKEAMEKALHVARKPRSSSLYAQLASKVSLNRCVDPSFLKLKSILQGWFAE